MEKPDWISDFSDQILLHAPYLRACSELRPYKYPPPWSFLTHSDPNSKPHTSADTALLLLLYFSIPLSRSKIPLNTYYKHTYKLAIAWHLAYKFKVVIRCWTFMVHVPWTLLNSIKYA